MNTNQKEGYTRGECGRSSCHYKVSANNIGGSVRGCLAAFERLQSLNAERDSIYFHWYQSIIYYVHVDNIPFKTPSNASFSTAAATRSLSFNCLFTYNQPLKKSRTYLTLTLMRSFSHSYIYAESLRQRSLESYPNT